MRWVLLLGFWLAGCGQTIQDRGGSTGGAGGVAVITGGSGGNPTELSGGSGGTAPCTPVGDAALRSFVPGCGEGCRGAATFVVRLDHESLEVLGWYVAGGTIRSIDETMARATAVVATGFGTDSDELELASEDLFIFYRSPGDFGGVAITSALFDEPLFGGEIVWSGRGSITYPLEWEPPETLGTGCGFEAGLVPSDEPQRSVVTRVGETALPQAFPDGLSGLTVYEYTPTVGITDFSVAEWLILVTGYGPAGV